MFYLCLPTDYGKSLLLMILKVTLECVFRSKRDRRIGYVQNRDNLLLVSLFIYNNHLYMDIQIRCNDKNAIEFSIYVIHNIHTLHY